MKKQHFSSFDREGFFFSIKFFGALLFLIFAIKAGGGFLIPNSDSQFSEETLAMSGQAVSFSKVKGVKVQNELNFSKEASTQFTKNKTAEDQPFNGIISNEGKFVGVDLVHMKTLLYEDGNIVDTFPILSKGTYGSHWETPSGGYEVKTKEQGHFSSIGRVYTPYRVQFSGNFFIHGWPYFPGGRSVPKGFAGGCVRLSTQDAKIVYEFVDIGTDVFVYERSEKVKKNLPLVEIDPISPPKTGARAYLVADLETGQVYAQKNVKEALPIASVTKLMTAVVASEAISFDDPILLAETGLSVSEFHFEAGEKLAIGGLLYPLLLESNNRVASSLARYYGSSLFLQRMNKKARMLGMKETFFQDASGLSPENVSTAKDLYYLARYLYHKKSFILDITRERARAIISNVGREYIFDNHTHFLDRERYVGGKIGYTPEALETMVAIFEADMGDDRHTIVFIVLGASDRESVVLELFRWLKKAT